MQEKVNKIISIICETVSDVLGEEVNPETLFDVREKNVNRSVSTARQLTHYVLHYVKGYSVTFIAKTTDTKKRTVFSNTKKARDFMHTDKEYKELVAKVKEKILSI